MHFIPLSDRKEHGVHSVRTITFSILFLACSLGSALSQPAASTPPANRPPPMVLNSSGFEDGGVLPSQFSGLAINPESPPLSWANAPVGTKSFVLQLRDMEPIRDKNFVDVIHWFAFDIPGTATSLPQGMPTVATLPDGTVQIANFSGKPGFIAPGAPPGTYHHYLIELFALDTTLPLTSTAGRDQVLAAMSGHILGKAVATFRFHR